MNDSSQPLNIDGEDYTIAAVFSEKNVIPFPIKVIDVSEQILVSQPEEHIGIRQQAQAGQIMATMNETGIWNVVQFTQDDVDHRLDIACRLIQSPKSFLDNPAAHVLKTAKTNKAKRSDAFTERRWTYRASSQKQYILDSVSNHISNVYGAKAISDSVLAITDELFTNSIYNAPFGDTDYTLDRTTTVFLDPELSSEMIVAHSDKYLLLGCLDHFGSFDCEEFIKRTAKCFELNVENVINRGIGGAGIGLLRMIDLTQDIFIVVEKDKRTFVGCRFPLNLSQRKIREASRNFFLSGFQSLESGNTSLRIERRGTKVLIHCLGRLEDDPAFKDLNLAGSTEISFNLRFLTEMVEPGGLQVFSALPGLTTLKKVYLDYLPITFLPKIKPLLKSNPELFEVRSLYHSVICGNCKGTQNFVLKPAGKTGNFASKCTSPCQSCGGILSF